MYVINLISRFQHFIQIAEIWTFKKNLDGCHYTKMGPSNIFG